MIIWLASYPKSGNTLLRSILSSYFYSSDGSFVFKNLEKISQFPLTSHLMSLGVNIDNEEDVFKNFINAQNLINQDKGKIKFFKTHSSLSQTYESNFTDLRNTLGTIYIVRDPRNVIGSISNHFSVTIEEAKNMVLGRRVLINTGKSYEHDVVTLLGSWGEHYKFWTKKNDNLLLLKYEDILLEPKRQLKKIILFLKKFIKFKIDESKENNIIAST